MAHLAPENLQINRFNENFSIINATEFVLFKYPVLSSPIMSTLYLVSRLMAYDKDVPSITDRSSTGIGNGSFFLNFWFMNLIK